jgi:preprotein translocase subunit SecF
MDKTKLNSFYDKNYKKILILPIIVLVLAIAFIIHFYVQTGDFLNRDISLTGGTTITVFTNLSESQIHSALEGKIKDLETRVLTDNFGNQNQIAIMSSQKPEEITPTLENFFGFKLTDKNSSVEFTGSNLSADFYKQLGITVLIAFFWMAAVVFVIFAKGWKVKSSAIILNLLFGIFLGKMFFSFPLFISLLVLLFFAIIIVFLYIKYSMPSFAVMFCAFADIIMTLAVVDLIGMKIAGAGIVAFLMLIGYSVDTDILLTTRVLTKKDTSTNREIFGSFKTGMTMTLTAITAIALAWIIVRPFQTVLNQMFEILLIGLVFDILNTWVTNTSLIKWFVERQNKV